MTICIGESIISVSWTISSLCFASPTQSRVHPLVSFLWSAGAHAKPTATTQTKSTPEPTTISVSRVVQCQALDPRGGVGVGIDVGESDGNGDGADVGGREGLGVGAGEVVGNGDTEGTGDGIADGTGETVGGGLGEAVGALVGACEGAELGITVGMPDGAMVGVADGGESSSRIAMYAVSKPSIRSAPFGLLNTAAIFSFVAPSYAPSASTSTEIVFDTSPIANDSVPFTEV